MEMKGQDIGTNGLGVSAPKSAGFAPFWSGRCRQANAFGDLRSAPAEVHNPKGRYQELTFTAVDGARLTARYLCPAAGGRVPTVLAFHDFDRPVRGWHHLTRFLALGYAVLALQNRTAFPDVSKGWRGAPEALELTALFSDALTAAHVALSLPHTDPLRLAVWGDGLGGGLALAVAAMFQENVVKCAVLNPLPANFRLAAESGSVFYAGIRTHFRFEDARRQDEDAFFQALEYVDCAQFAPMLSCGLLMGTALMDPVSPPAAQQAVYEGASCKKRLLVYPKHAHERVNAFEDELLAFLHP